MKIAWFKKVISPEIGAYLAGYKRTTFLLFCAGILSLSAALPEIAPGKAWREKQIPAGTKETVFSPVLKDHCIEFGEKIIRFSPNGSFQCTSGGSGSILECEQPYFWVEKDGNAVWVWRNRQMDKTRSKFYRSGSKYIWELWYQDDGLPPFHGITQVLEALPDGLLKLAWKYHFPPDSQKYKFKIWNQFLSLPAEGWNGGNVRLAGREIKLAPEMKAVSDPLRKGQLQWTFAPNDPARTFSLLIRNGEKQQLSLSYHKSLRKYQLAALPLVPKQWNTIYLDFRKGIAPESGRDIRCGVDFRAQQNMLMPDDRHRNLVRNASFERGLEGWNAPYSNFDRQWDWIPFALDSRNALDGSHSLRMEVRAGSPWRPGNPAIGPMVIVTEPGSYTLSFYARTEPGKKPVLTVWLPSHSGGRFRPAINGGKAAWDFPLGDQWKRYQTTFEIKPSDPHIFLAFYGRNATGKAKVWLDAVQLEKGKKASSFEPPPAEGRLITSEPDNFISSKAKIDGRFRITTDRPDKKGTVRITVKNFFGEILLDLTRTFHTGRDRTAEIGLPLDGLPGLGLFVVKAEYRLNDGSSAYDLRRYARVEFQTEEKPNRKMFAIDYQAVSRSVFFLPKLKRWQKLGVGSKHWVLTVNRADWETYEKYGVTPYMGTMLSYLYGKPGVPQITDFFILDPKKAEEGPVTGLSDPRIRFADFHLEPGGKITPEYLEKLKQTAKRIAKDYPQVKYWALGGELTCKMPLDWWGKNDSPPEAMHKIALHLKAFAEGVREGNPKAGVVQDSPANMSPSGGIAETALLLEECNKLGVKFDLIAIHPYRHSPEDPDLDADAAKFLEMLEKRGYGKTPVLWSEGMLWGPYEIPQWGTKIDGGDIAPAVWRRGPLSYDIGWSEKKSAAWYARSWLVALKYGSRIAGFTSGSVVNNCYMDCLLTPYAAQLSSNTLCCLLGDAKFRKDVRFASFVRSYIFEDAQKRPVAAVWCHRDAVDNGAEDAPVFTADFGNSLEGVFDFMNSPRAFTPGRMRFPVSSFPLFFRGKPGTLKQMTAALEQAEQLSGTSVPPLEVSANPTCRTTAALTFKNLISRELSGSVNGKPLRIPGSGKAVVSLPLPSPVGDRTIVREKLSAKWKSDTGAEQEYRFDFEALCARKVSDRAEIDTLDWSGLPAVPFTRQCGKTVTSGTFRLGWNRNGLFLEAAVRDGKFVFTEYPQVFKRWKNDCLQIYFDTFANARQRKTPGSDGDDYEYALFPNVKGTAGTIFRYKTVESQLGLANQAPPDRTFAPDIPCRFTNKDGILTYRVFFPAKYLLPMKMEKGWVLGFCLFAVNSDRAGEFNGALTLTSDGGPCSNRPHTWPVVILTE